MTATLSAPRSPAEWSWFATGVFVVVTAAVFLTTRNPWNALQFGGTSAVVSLATMVVLVFLWRRAVAVISRN